MIISWARLVSDSPGPQDGQTGRPLSPSFVARYSPFAILDGIRFTIHAVRTSETPAAFFSHPAPTFCEGLTPMRLQVASYNIHRGFGRDGRYEPQRILQVLQELDADIIALQEVDLLRPGTPQILPWLAARTNLTAVAGMVQSKPEGDYGNALLTRFPIKEVRRWDLSVGTHEPRGVLDLDVNWNGRSIRVLNTHLGLWPRERFKQVQRLLELLDVRRPDLTLLMGDLNEWQVRGKLLQGLRRMFGSPAAPVTFPARWPLLALDRIWAAPASALVAIQAHRTILSRNASDHLPVRAEIALEDSLT